MHDEDNFIYVGANKTIDLTVKENKILSLLIGNKGNVITHKQLCKLIYGDVDYYFIECMRNKIFGLRKKLKDEVEILNVRGVGYKIVPKTYQYEKESMCCPYCGRQL